jgi:hypothetical protein
MKSLKQYSLGLCIVGITDWEWFRKYPVEMASDGITYNKFHEDWFGHSGNIKVITSTVWEAGKDLYVYSRDDLGMIHTY